MPSTGRPSHLGSIRSHSNFQTRTARDDAGELNRRSSVLIEEQVASQASAPSKVFNPYEPATNDSTPPPHEHALTKRLLHPQSHDGGNSASRPRRSISGRRRLSASQRRSGAMGADSLTAQKLPDSAEDKKANGDSSAPKPGLGPRPVGGDEKLGMFSGVYVPTCLNVLSILMFLRFGFILG